MTERITHQEDIDAAATNHLRAILPLLECIGAGYTEQVSAGYVEREGEEERLTDMGVSMVESAYKVAWDSATYLFEDVLANAAPSLDTDLLDDVQQFLAVTAAALDGMDIKGAPPGVAPPWVSTCLLSMARDLMERMDDGGSGWTRDRRSTEEEESTTDETPPPAERSTPTLDQYHWVCDLVDAVNVTAALLAPFCLDAGNPGFKGRDEGEVTAEGWRCLSAVTRAIDEVMAAEKRVDELILAVPTCLIPLQWTLHSLEEAHRNPTPDLFPAENAAEILDFAFDQVLGLAQHVRQYADGMKAAAT